MVIIMYNFFYNGFDIAILSTIPGKRPIWIECDKKTIIAPIFGVIEKGALFE